MQPSLEDVFVQITGIEAEAMRKEKEKKGVAAYEMVDCFLEHPCQGHAGLLSQTAQCQLGFDFSSCLGRDVLYQVRRWFGECPFHSSRRGGRFHPIWNHLHALGDRDL